jgi:predicted ATPase/Tfp pilus assembly protein PilF
MGAVYAARDVVLDRLVAIKVLSSAHEGDEERRRWLIREARSAAALSHPNIATVFEAGVDEDTVYVAMELCEGETLAAALTRGPLTLALVRSIGLGIARGLESAHAAGVVHRDLKPANVVLVEGSVPKLVDFGLARPPAGGASMDARMSFTGLVVGTPGYMAPEQIRGEAADGRADLFSLGVVLHEMWTGQAPFGTNALSAMATTLYGETPSLSSRLGAPWALVDLVSRLLERDVAARPASASEVADALERLELEPASGRTLPPNPSGAPTEGAIVRVSEIPKSDPLPLIGRDADVQRVEDELARFARLVTLVGPPGTGKSATVTEVASRARQRGERVTWVALFSMTSMEEAAAALSLALRPPGSKASLDELVAVERGLICFDGGEAIASALGRQIERWLGRSRWVRFVVASRVELGTPSERALLLGPLPLASARELFVARARRVRPLLVLDESERAAVDAIVQALECNPLAIGLLAARVPMLAPTEMARRLLSEGRSEERLQLLDRAAGTTSSSLREAIAWSFALLDPAVSRIALRLSLFEGPFDSDSAEKVARLPDEPVSKDALLAALEALRAASLIRVVTEADGGIRLAMDANVRAFARAELASDPRRREVVEAFVRRLGGVAETALLPGGRASLTAAEEGGSLRSAVRYALEAPKGSSLVVPGLWAAVILVLHRSEPWLETALRSLLLRGPETPFPTDLIVRAELALFAEIAERDLPVALEVARSAVARCLSPASAASPELLTLAQGTLFDGFLRAGRLDDGEALARTMSARARPQTTDEIDALERLATIAWRRSVPSAMLLPLRRALGLAEVLRDRPRQAKVLLMLGVLCVQEARFSEARGFYERARELARAEHLNGVVATLANNLGVIHHEEGRLEQARSSFLEAAREGTLAGRAFLVAVAHGNAGMAEHELGNLTQARADLDTSLSMLAVLGDARYRAALSGARAVVHADTGKEREARADLAVASQLLAQAHEPQLALALSIRAVHVDVVFASNEADRVQARAAAEAHLLELRDPESMAARSDLARMALRALSRAVG